MNHEILGNTVRLNLGRIPNLAIMRQKVLEMVNINFSPESTNFPKDDRQLEIVIISYWALDPSLSWISEEKADLDAQG